MAKKKEEPPSVGPRGGTTTRTEAGMVKKNMWISLEDYERLRRMAFETRKSEAELIRVGLSAVLDGKLKLD